MGHRRIKKFNKGERPLPQKMTQNPSNAALKKHYKTLRNRITKTRRIVKAKYYDTKFQNCNNVTKKKHGIYIINGILHNTNKGKEKIKIKEIKIDNKMHNNPQDMANIIINITQEEITRSTTTILSSPITNKNKIENNN